MESQSQTTLEYQRSRIRSKGRREEREEMEHKRFRLRLLCFPGVVAGAGGIIWYLIQPYPAQYWLLGLLSVAILTLSLCLPLAVKR